MPAVTLSGNTFLSLAPAGEGSGTNSVFYHTCSGNNRLLVVSVVTITGGGTDPSYVYYNNVAMTLANTTTNGGVGVYVRTYYLTNPSAGNNTVIVRWAAASRGGIVATSFSNVSTQYTPPFSFLSNTSLSLTTPSTNGFKVYDVVAIGSGDSANLLAGANQTELSNFVGSPGAGGNAARIGASIEDGNTSSNTVMSWTSNSGAGLVHTAISIISTDPSIIDVDGDNSIFTGQQNIVANGYNLAGQTNISLVSSGKSINITTTSSNANSIVFNAPYSENLFSSNVGFGSVTLNVASFSFPLTLNPNSSYFIHTVANTSQNANSGCLYYNITPAISSNDKFYLPANTYFGSNLTIDTQGFPTINSSTDVTDFFKYRIYDISDSTWGSEGTFVSIGSYNLASNTTVPTVVPAPDNRRYFRNPDGSSSKKITNNSEIILFGTFPAKANAAPVYFDNYNGRANGTLATSIGLKNLQGDGTTPQVSNTRSFTGTKSLRVDYSTASGSFFPRIGIDGLSANQVYISAHIYWERYVTGAANSFIFKLCRAGSNDSYTGAPRFYETVFANHTTGAITTTDRGYVQSNSNAVLVTTLNKGPNRDSWSRTEYYYRLSTPGVSDGVFQTSVDNVRNANVTNALTRIAGDSNTINWVISPFDGLDTKGIDNAYYLYVDNLYIDTTQVRVEVGDAPTLAACTNKLCAIPSFWSTSKIVATVDTSIWPVGTALYAFVIDENGNQVASSYAMTVS